MAIFVLQNIFENDKSLFHLDLSIFRRIFGLYKAFYKRVLKSEASIKGIPTNDGILLFSWNNLIADILKINTKMVPLPKVIHIFFQVQEIFTETLFNFTFEYIIHEDSLQKNYDADPSHTQKFDFQMISQSQKVLQEMHQNNDYYVGTQQNML